jgi:hypothetical protein
MAIEKKVLCPLLNQECIEDGAIVKGKLTACNFWVVVQGKHPQTGEDINQGNCCLNWVPMLLIENSKTNRETGAAIESFRNEMVKSNQVTQEILLTTAGKPANNLIEVKDEINNN